jgi:hypothetical protein
MLCEKFFTVELAMLLKEDPTGGSLEESPALNLEEGRRELQEDPWHKVLGDG